MSIPLERIDSRSELRERLRTTGHVVLGEDDESPREYFIVQTPACSIGICSQRHGPKPSVFIDESREIAWVGYNSKVANVSVRSCRRNFAVELESVFFAIVCQMYDGSVIAIHELGATRIGGLGGVIWTCATNVVTEFLDEGKDVRLRTDAGEVRIDKETGAKQ